MARVKFFDNTKVSRYNQFSDYEITGTSGSSITMKYSVGGYDEDVSPWRIKLEIENPKTYDVEQGDAAGETRYSSGEITKVSYYDDSGNKLLAVSGIKASLPYFSTAAANDGLDNFYSYLISADASNFTDGRDVHTGSGNDTVEVGKRDSLIRDAGGKDSYEGGKGHDAVSYADFFYGSKLIEKGITANLKENKIQGPDGFTDTVKKIEEVRGTFLKDTLKGSSEDETFAGMQGKDEIDGRSGLDIVRYDLDAAQGGTDRAVVKLADGFAKDGFGNRDKLSSIEGAIGTDNDDDLRGNSKKNYFDGGGGDDQIRLYEGKDTIRGGDGRDEFRFYGSKFGSDRIEDFENGRDKIDIREADSFSDLRVIENSDGDAVIKLIGADDARVILEGVSESAINAGDFIF